MRAAAQLEKFSVQTIRLNGFFVRDSIADEVISWSTAWENKDFDEC